MRWFLVFMATYLIYITVDSALHDWYSPNFLMWAVISAIVADKANEDKYKPKDN